MIYLLLGFDDHCLGKTLTQISAHWYSWQTWLIAMHCSPKTFHFLSVSNGPTSFFIRYCLNSAEITRNQFCGIFLKNCKYLRKMFLRCFWKVLNTSQKSHLLRCFWEVSEMSLSMEIWLRSPRDISRRLGKVFWEYAGKLQEKTHAKVWFQ